MVIMIIFFTIGNRLLGNNYEVPQLKFCRDLYSVAIYFNGICKLYYRADNF